MVDRRLVLKQDAQVKQGDISGQPCI